MNMASRVARPARKMRRAGGMALALVVALGAAPAWSAAVNGAGEAAGAADGADFPAAALRAAAAAAMHWSSTPLITLDFASLAPGGSVLLLLAPSRVVDEGGSPPGGAVAAAPALTAVLNTIDAGDGAAPAAPAGIYMVRNQNGVVPPALEDGDGTAEWTDQVALAPRHGGAIDRHAQGRMLLTGFALAGAAPGRGRN